MDFKGFYDEIIFDVDRSILKSYTGKQGDTKSRGLYVTVMQKNAAIEDLTGLSMRFFYEKPDKTRGFIDGVVDGNKFRIDYTNQMYAVPGVVKAELRLMGVDDEIITAKTFKILVDSSIADGSIVSENERGILDRAFELAEDIIPRLELLDVELLENVQGEIEDARHDSVNDVTYDSLADRLNQDKLDYATLEGRIDTILTTPAEGVSAQEIIDARGGEATLGGRLNKVDLQLAQNAKKLEGTVNVMSFGAKGDGVTDDTVAIQNAIDSISRGTVFFPPKVFIAQGIVPKSNVTLIGYGAFLKLPETPTNHLITYNSDTQLINFNVYGISFDAHGLMDYDLININQPNWGAPTKTWYMSVIQDCNFYYGKTGIKCPVPGSVKVNNCQFVNCDVGMEWEQEHFYINDTVFWHNRIGINSIRGCHFSCVNGVFAHCDEYGVVWGGFEAIFSGCSFIDNPLGGIKGAFARGRIIGNRIIQCGKGIEILSAGGHNLIANNQIMKGMNARNITDAETVIGIEINSESNEVTGNTLYNNKYSIVVKSSHNNISSNNFRLLNSSNETGILIDTNTNGNSILGNTFKYGLRAIELRSGTVQELIIANNNIRFCLEEGIKSTAKLNGGCIISQNTITDVSFSADNTFSGIKLESDFRYSSISGNTFRNSTAGKMKNAIECAVGISNIDSLVVNNIARNMKGTSSYVIPATVTTNSNIGTISEPA